VATLRPEAIETRPPRAEDAPQIAALVTEATRGWLGRAETTAETVTSSWRAPSVDPEQDLRIAIADDELAGYAFLQPRASSQSMLWLDLWTCAGAGERAVAAALITALEPRANAVARYAPPAATVRLRTLVDESSGPREALERCDFSIVRGVFQMVADLDQVSGTPTWPEGLRVRTYLPSDARALHALAMEVLADTWEFVPEPFETWVADTEAPGFDPGLWWIAEHDGELVAVMLCAVDEADPELVWLKVAGVQREWRGRWLALKLFLHAAQEFQARGLRRSGVGVDASNPSGANLLAGRSGFQVARRYLIYEKRLRGPRPVRRLLRRARHAVRVRSSR